ncbi:hypothetical protein LUZ63_000361 [Rhynchospora breviuscula]|uniref:Uncharacterized protein n=1 Tax=Rhynchospora breviuscula TaxID=2022672 RepID=A0A9Q0CVR1_9POAL|nr:hypothetical protein LUZ63_000361 [Rhynchospora breviuscula]
MAHHAYTLLALALVLSNINGSFAARHLLDVTKSTAAPEAEPTMSKPTIPAIPTTLPPILLIPKVTIPTTIPNIPTALPPISSIPSIPTVPTVPTALPPMPAIPSIPSIPNTMPKVPAFQVPPIPSPSATTSP